MKLITAPLSTGWLRDCLEECKQHCARVRAAIAYADMSNMTLFEACRTYGKPLDFYGRYDHTVPVDPRILRWFQERKSMDLRCHLVPDFLHAKVIWWVDAGAYIGSANLTDRAWNKNYEAGCFFSREEIVNLGIEEQLAAFFENLDDYARPMTDEIIEEQERLQKDYREVERAQERIEQGFAKTRLLRPGKNPSIISNETALGRHFRDFQDEWDSTLQVMRNIAYRISSEEFRPNWIPANSPGGAQADQFLHAFYYQRVRNGIHFPVEEFFKRNEGRREHALIEAIRWWKEGNYHRGHELNMLGNWAPAIEKAFSRHNLATLTEAEWIDAGSKIHAVRDYAGKHSSADLGSPEKQLEQDEKVREHCRILWSRRSSSGTSVRDLLMFVIWGPGSVSERLWRGCRTPEWKIDGIGLSTLGEVVGWSRPNEFPPRNMRTSKGLRSLGFDVHIG